MKEFSEQPELEVSQVDSAIADYLEKVDRGEIVDRHVFLNAYPGLEEEIRSFFADIDDVDRVVSRNREEKSGSAESATPLSSSVAAHSIDTSKIAGHMPSVVKRAEPMRTVPEYMGRFQIIRCLGEGGMGAVYLARDTLLGRQVALKIPHALASYEPVRRDRFLREAQAAATLHHPNICQVFDVGETDGIPFIAMAYVEGASLASILAEGRRPPLRDSVVLVSKIAAAMQDAHSHGTVHRDLKPANIMINHRNEPVIMDFGLALQVNQSSDARVTKPGTVMGTPAYMSPEQITGDPSAVGASTDIYSLGVILFELLVGRLPFLGSSAEIMVHVLKDDAPRPSTFQPEISPELDAINRRMLSRRIDDRYPDMGAVAADLKAYLRSSRSALDHGGDSVLELPFVLQESGVAPPTVTIERNVSAEPDLAKGSRRKWGILTASMTLLILLAAGIAAMTVSLGQDHHRVKFQVDETVPNGLEVQIDGRRVELSDLKAGLRLEPGDQHHWAIWRGDDAMLLTKDFVVAEGENPVVTITLQGENTLKETPVPPVTQKPEFLRKLAGYKAGIGALAMSPDGKTLAVGSGASVDLWNYSQGVEIRKITLAGDEQVSALSFDPSGNMLAVSGVSSVRIFDAARGTEARTLQYKSTNTKSLVYSPDGRWLAAATRGGNITLWDLNGPGDPREIADSQDAVSLAFGPRGQLLASAHQDGTARLWDSLSGMRKLKVKVHPEGRAYCIAFSPDGKLIATGADGGVLKLWDVVSGNEKHQLLGHGNPVESVAFHSSGRYLASSGGDNTLRLWEIESGREIHRIILDTPIETTVFSADGQILAAASADAIHLFRLPVSMVVPQTPGLISTMSDHGGFVNSIAFSPNGTYLASAGRGKPGPGEKPDSDVRIWDLGARKLVRRLSSTVDSIRKVRFSPDGKTIVAMSENGLFQFWDATNGERKQKFGEAGAGPVASGTVLDFDFLPDGSRLVVVGTQGYHIVRLDDLQVVAQWKSDGDLGAVSAYSDGRSSWLLSGGIRSRQITRWNALLAEKNATWKASDPYLDLLVCTPDAQWALSGAAGVYELWDLQEPSEQRPVHRWDHPRVNGPHYHPRVAAISPDGSQVLLTTQAAPPALVLIDAASGETVQEFLGHDGTSVSAIAISPDGRIAASAGLDGKVFLWRLPERIDRERMAAEWVLKIGGRLLTQGSTRAKTDVRKMDELPKEAFHCIWVTLLKNPSVTDDGLRNLSGLRHLDALQLSGTHVTDEGLKHLNGLPKLKHLNLDDTQVSDLGIQRLAGLSNLELLSLNNTRVTGLTFPDLISCQKLRVLSLYGSQVTDGQIPYLNGLPELEDLYLGRTPITDDCVQHLARLKRLRIFGYQGSKMTEDGVRKLKQAIPNLLLLRDK